MQRAIRLAMNGRGKVEPNPMVGCVIVKNGQIIGEGYHQQFGAPHAEPNALANCTESPQGATAYVTLEPCCHTNKKTPPCVPRLIDAKLARVVVGTTDPNPHVDGQGLAQLREAGISVDAGVLETECKQLLAPFIAHTVEKRPYVTLKWAETADEKIAGNAGARLQITNVSSSHLVQQLRANCDGVMVGIATAKIDDPLLTARGVPRSRLRHRILLDSGLNLGLNTKLVTTALECPLTIFCSDSAYREGRRLSDRITLFEQMGIVVKAVEDASNRGVSIPAVMTELHRMSLTHLLVEPGPTLATGFFKENLADRLWVFRSPNAINDPTAPAAAKIPDHFIPTGTLNLDGDILTEYLNPQSPVFFAPVPSADFVLAAGI